MAVAGNENTIVRNLCVLFSCQWKEVSKKCFNIKKDVSLLISYTNQFEWSDPSVRLIWYK